MKNKRGSSHLEVILSFVIFVGFTFFLLTYLQPTQKTSLENSILDGLESSFLNNVEINFTKVLVNSTFDCKPAEVAERARVFNLSKSGFFYIYASDEISGDDTTACSAGAYKLGFINSEKVVSNKSLEIFRSRYYGDYNALKISLNVPLAVDFAIVAEGYAFERQIPEQTEVKSRAVILRVLYADGSIINKDFLIKIW
jgi:hypothetical protein